VLRGGRVREVAADTLVPGDVVLLESGNRVPADLRLLGAQGLEIDESLLTGESLPVQKDMTWTGPATAPVSDRHNMGHAGSVVVRGRGRGLVVATGTATAVGELALDVLGTAGGKPPLLERMERFTRVVAIGILLAAVGIGTIGVLLRGFALTDMFLFGVALAVSAIPEGLPVAMTVALAVATTRMARRGVIVRRLAAVEGLGSCTCIASDKTGTLTCNELTVREVHLPGAAVLEVTGEGFVPAGELRRGAQSLSARAVPALAPLVRAGVLCNEAELREQDGAWQWRGDPTDVALLTLATKLGWPHGEVAAPHAEVAQIPFESEHQYAASFRDGGDATRVYVKGAPERVLDMCAISAADRAAHLAAAGDMAARGYRVIALAEGPVSRPTGTGAPPTPENLEFLGYVGMIDPLRSGVREAVAACREAGITVVMITGDHPVTALAIARDLGMADSPEQVVTGAELQGQSSEELRAYFRRARVFARVAPRQKLELVQAARAEGHYVAVTGDGVNDAPALRTANIGVAMGKAGTDVAREAAELVITDDNFATIVAGVEEGRVAYDNVRKVIYLLISTGVAEVLMLGAAILTGMPLPLLPVQLLWLNLVTNGIQDVALAFEPGEGDALRRRPRPPRESIFNRLMIERTLVGGLVMAGLALGLFAVLLQWGFAESTARNLLLLLMVLLQNLHVGNARSETRSAFALSPLRNPLLLGGVIIAQLLHIGTLYAPLGQRVLHTEPVTFVQWLLLLALASVIVLAMELHKWTWRLRQRRRGDAR